MMLTVRPRLPLPAGLRDRTPAAMRRRSVQSAFLVVVALSVFLLFEYASYLSGGVDDADADAPYDPTLDTVYLPFRPTRPAVARTLRPTLPLPEACLDAHIARGDLCYSPAEPRLDVLWTWVNGSDVLLQDAKARIEARMRDDPYRPNTSWKQVRQFRDHDELRYSMRSVLAYFRPYTGRFHILTSDFAIPAYSTNLSVPLDYRLGQVPQWLNSDNSPWSDGQVQLSIKHHADIFAPYPDTTFNSYAIESQFGHLEDISENFIYMNDDFFFLQDLTPRTFYTSTYGLVFRMQSDLLVSPTQYRNNVKGEWRSLAAANVLLSERFGERFRPYVTHEAKAASRALLHELGTVWAAPFGATAAHPFRETKGGESDPSALFMLVHFVVERWREGLLWAWAVAKHGAPDDAWAPAAAGAAWRELGGEEGVETLSVRAARRATLDPERVEAQLRGSGHRQADSTTYEFSSQDGYPYLNLKPAQRPNKNANKWPRFGAGVAENDRPQCTIEYAKCFRDERGRVFTSASEFFKHVAFRERECGDCMTMALVKASGELGLEAFLPPPERTFTPGLGRIFASRPAADDVPHLPLTPTWAGASFALRDVLSTSRETNVRAWALRMLQRYRFAIADTPAHFAMLTGPSNFNSMVTQLAKRPETALLCVNDDVAVDDARVADMFGAWAQGLWGVPALWERR